MDGSSLSADKGEPFVQFEVWAPQAERVALHCEGTTRAMERDPDREGWWTGEADAQDGTRYGFALDDEWRCPTPAHAASRTGPTA